MPLEALSEYWLDDLFPLENQTADLSGSAIFELPESTKRFLDHYVLPIEAEHERFLALRQWVFEQFSRYEYDANQTVSVSELVNTRKINCLSFSAMFVAAARYVDIPADFQLVYAPPYWDLESDTWIVNQHINVYGDIKVPRSNLVVINEFHNFRFSDEYLYGLGVSIPRSRGSTRQRYIADINRAVVSIPFSTRPLNENQVKALFYNNQAVEHLNTGELTVAYHHIKLALQQDRSLSAVWNTLGVLYQRLGQLAMAEKAYLAAIDLGEDILSAQSNLAIIYRATNRAWEAEQLQTAIADHRHNNPYFHYALGEKSMQEGDPNGASSHFKQAIKLKHNEEIFYYALAKAEVKLGEYDNVEKNLKQARIYAKGEGKNKYRNKLEAFTEAVASAR